MFSYKTSLCCRLSPAGWLGTGHKRHLLLFSKKIENFMSKAAKSITFEWIRVLKRFAPVFDGFVTWPWLAFFLNLFYFLRLSNRFTYPHVLSIFLPTFVFNLCFQFGPSSPASFCLFSSFQTNKKNSANKCPKISILNPPTGVELMTSPLAKTSSY